MPRSGIVWSPRDFGYDGKPLITSEMSPEAWDALELFDATDDHEDDTIGEDAAAGGEVALLEDASERTPNADA